MKPTNPVSIICCAISLAAHGSHAQSASATALVSLAAEPTFLYSSEAAELSATTTMLSASDLLNAGHAFAAADLPSGTLKLSVGGEFSKPGTNWVMATASFSDTFTTTTTEGSPFVWANDTTARFNISLDGIASVSTVFDASDFSARFFPPNWSVSISAAPTEEYERWRQGDPTAVLSRASYLSREGVNLASQPTLQYDGLFTGLTAAGDLMSGLDLQFDLAPGEDFTWIVTLWGFGTITDSFLVDSFAFEIDLAHTASVSYFGPDDSITYSLSGFPGTSRAVVSPVPEPSTHGILTVTFIALAILRRKMCMVRQNEVVSVSA